MNRSVLLLLFPVAFLATGCLQADDNAIVSSVSTATSENYPEVTCSSTDPALNADAVQLAEETRDQLGPLLKLGLHWRFPVRIHIVTPDDPLAGRVHGEAIAAIIAEGGRTMEIDLVLPSSDSDLREAIQRQYVTAMLWEKFFPTGQVFDTHTRLDIVPVWLTEGLREWLNDDPEHVREAIVKRAVAIQNTPTLAEIAGWHELSPQPLYSLWQRAFCYYLVNSLVRAGPRRDDFQNWIDSLTGPNPADATYLFPTEAAWQHELLQSPAQSLELVYTWEQTAAEFDTAQTFTLAFPGEKQVRTCTLDEVSTLPLKEAVMEAIQQKILVLTSLELRAHVSWRPIIALYRFALTGFIANNNPVGTEQLFEEAKNRRETEIDYHQKITDYVNWYQVVHEDQAPGHFSSYFSLADELERAEAPQPNPIRATVLRVESQFNSGDSSGN